MLKLNDGKKRFNYLEVNQSDGINIENYYNL